jgi:hypothetical protein
MSGILVFEPARAQAVAILAAVTCSSSSPCASEQNKGSGNAILGTAVGDSIHGISTGSGKSGVFGETDSKSGGYGVKGTNSATGGIAVYGAGGSGTGVKGTTTTSKGVEGDATGGVAVYGLATIGDGVHGSSTTGTGVYGLSDTRTGVFGVSSTGTGVIGASDSGEALYGVSYSETTSALEADNNGTPTSSASFRQSDGAHIYSKNGNGAIIENGTDAQTGIPTDGQEYGKWGAAIGGQLNGLIVTEGSGSEGTPLNVDAEDSSGNTTGYFAVDGGGDISYSGSAISMAQTRDGAKVTAFETKATQAGFEDSGTAQLVAGSAFVSLDPAFARAIDLRSLYRVFLTPDGDTRGLYVAGKTPTGFTVRETQGGRGTFAFDYRILASAAGGTGDRTTLVTPAVAARFFPMLAAHGRMKR